MYFCKFYKLEIFANLSFKCENLKQKKIPFYGMLFACCTRNGRTASAPLVGRYCGNRMSDPIIRSHSNSLYLKMKTNSYYAARGFKITYEAAATGKIMMIALGLEKKILVSGPPQK